MKLDFVRGHMGGNVIILLRGDQIPQGLELETAVKLLGPNYLYAHEAGILYPAEKPGQLKVKVAEPTVPCFISACGGFTQVLGAALVETSWGPLFDLEVDTSPVEVLLHTDCGPTMISVEQEKGKAKRVRTNMECFVEECYERGVHKMEFEGLEVMKSGKFLVINADQVRRILPAADFTQWSDKTRLFLDRVQRQFMKETGEVEPNVTLYDWHPAHQGHLRVVYPHLFIDDDVFEPSCGTGTVALGLALLAAGELEDLKKEPGSWLTLELESGGGLELGGPELTRLEMKIAADQVKSAVFSHSLVEITALGEVRL